MAEPPHERTPRAEHRARRASAVSGGAGRRTAGEALAAQIEWVLPILVVSYGRLMIAAAIDYESAQWGVLSERARRTAHRLEVATLTMEPQHTAGRVLVTGAQIEALLHYATRHRHEVVILGPGAHTPRTDAEGPLVVHVGRV